jgi:cellulose synthase/poly-beta-1,6-N-acetylglucosamine synthase-like glycosyltransferase
LAAVNQESKPTVSIIVPVQNGEKTIPALLESLMKLDYNRDRLEFLVVDGNSEDKTKDIVKQYSSIKLITQDGNGLNAGRNTGIRNSKSEIIVFTDSDCIIPVDWVRNIVKNFDDPRIGCLGGSIKGCNGDFLSDYADHSFMPVLRNFRKREVLDSVRLLQRYPAGCNMAFRRKAIETAGDFDESIRHAFDEDELVERVCRSGYKMVLDPDCLVLHKHRSSLKELLKQNFRYGRGIGFLLKKNKLRDAITKWALLNLAGCVSWFFLGVILASLVLTSGWRTFYIFPLGLALAPLVGLAVVYAYRALKNGHISRIVTYPFIDILRLSAFSIGEIYQLLASET